MAEPSSSTDPETLARIATRQRFAPLFCGLTLVCTLGALAMLVYAAMAKAEQPPRIIDLPAREFFIVALISLVPTGLISVKELKDLFGILPGMGGAK